MAKKTAGHPDWRVDGNKGVPPKVGKHYRIEHSRKGTFTCKIISVDDEWAEIEIIEGEAKAMSAGGSRRAGEWVTVRASQSQLFSVDK